MTHEPISPSQARIGDQFTIGGGGWQHIQDGEDLSNVREFQWPCRRATLPVRAALMTGVGSELALHEITPLGPSYGQVLVRVIASGICGAQLQEMDGRKQSGPLPHPLGHEGVGIVEAVGTGVVNTKAGNKVVLHWRPGDGCQSDYPVYQFGSQRITGGKCCTFMEKTIVSENRCTVVPDDAPDDLCCLLGCSLSTALGTMEHEAKLLMGESVLIIGCGGLGLNLILAAKMMGSEVHACDVDERKLHSAQQLGAFYSWGKTPMMGCHFNVVIDTSGNSEAIEHGLTRLAPSGRMILVGQLHENVTIRGPIHLFAGNGKTIRATQGGRFEPHRDIPRYIAAWRSGYLKIEGIITHRFKLSEINEAIALVRSGQAGRVIITP